MARVMPKCRAGRGPTARLLRISPGRRRLLGEAIGELIRAAWLVRIHSFPSYAEGLGKARAGDPAPIGEGDLAELQDIRWALTRWNKLLAGKFTCLMLAIAGKRMLARRRVPNSLVLGVKCAIQVQVGDARRDLAAHAWLRVPQGVLIGDEARIGYTPVVSFHHDREVTGLFKRQISRR